MRVQTAEVQRQAQHEVGRTQPHNVEASRGASQVGGATELPPAQRVDAVQWSAEAEAIEVEHREFPLKEEELAPQHELKLQLAKRIIEKMLGARFKILRPDDLVSSPAAPAGGGPPEAPAAPPGEAGGPVGDGAVPTVELAYYGFYAEPEAASLSAKALVETADGQRLDVDLSLELRRSFSRAHGVNLRAARQRLVDPVVVRFAGPAADLTERSFKFDLDAAGFEEQIAVHGAGATVSPLDRDRDGKVDDASALGGPMTGDGFSDLQRFEDDDGGLVDASGAVYDRLRLWDVDDGGSRSLLALGDRRLGALYLGHVETVANPGGDAVAPVAHTRDAAMNAQPGGAPSLVDLVA